MPIWPPSPAARGALFHTDAVQAIGKIPVDVRALGVDLLALSAHKFYGPKGTGALWIRRGTRLVPQMTGGKHERNRRAGTESVPAIAAMGVAAALAGATIADAPARVGALRDRLERGILAQVPGTVVNGSLSPRVANTTNVSFDRVEAESLLIALDLEGVAVSTGSACSSGTLEPSHVLRAMGLPSHRTQNSIRFSLGSGNTEAEVDRVLDLLPRLVDKLRRLTRKTGTGAHGVRKVQELAMSNGQRAMGYCARPRQRINTRCALLHCSLPTAKPRLTAKSPPMRIVVAMSGGVDSSVAAALLADEGHDVVGLSMQLYDQQEGEASFGSCCSLDDLHDARRVAGAIGIPHYIVNFERQFHEHVIGNFVREYAAGRTPLPCARCNSDLKFATLVERAQGLDAAVVATGHYAQVDRDPASGRWRLRRGADAARDQSVLPLLAHAGAAGGGGLSDRSARQAGGPPVRPRARTAGRRQARQPGDLLRPRPRLCGVRREAGPGGAARRSHRRPGRRRPRPARGRAPVHRRPAQGARPLLVGAALRAGAEGR